MTSDTGKGCFTRKAPNYVRTGQQFSSPPKASLDFSHQTEQVQPSVDAAQALKEADWVRLTWGDWFQRGRAPPPPRLWFQLHHTWCCDRKLATSRKVWPFLQPISHLYSALCSHFLSSCKSSYNATPWRDWRQKFTTLGVFFWSLKRVKWSLF